MSRSSRRGFLSTLGALAGAAAIPLEPARARSAAPRARGGWDLSWLDQLTGKHKQVFDLADLEIGLIVVHNWLNAHEEVYGLRHPELNAVVGIASRGFPINAGSALYRRFPIGAEWKVTDPKTGRPAERNLFLGAESGPGSGPGARAPTVRALQARGAIFWQCNNALHGVAARLAAKVGRRAPEVYEELKAGLNPGVILIPAHTMLIGLAQEHGCAYEML